MLKIFLPFVEKERLLRLTWSSTVILVVRTLSVVHLSEKVTPVISNKKPDVSSDSTTSTVLP